MLYASVYSMRQGVVYMPSFVERSYRDWSGEVSGFGITTYAITDANFSNHVAHQAALDAAIDALTSGTLAKTSFGTRELVSSADGPFGSQRERKILVTYTANSTQKVFRVEIPCEALVEANFLAGSDELDLANAEVLALKDAFEDIARSPDNGTEAVTVLSMRFVGRNL